LPETAPTSQGNEAPARVGQRISCPSCGKFLFRWKKVEPTSATVSEEHKCGGCHRVVDVTYSGGKISVALS